MPFLCGLLYLGTGIISKPDLPTDLVEHITDADVQGLTEYAVPTVGECDDLGVAARGIEKDRVLGGGLDATDL